MGREIRRVPPNYQHPQYFNRYRGLEDVSMLPESLVEAQTRWDQGKALWDSNDPSVMENKKIHDNCSFEDFDGERPEECEGLMYRTWDSAEATWFQVWQTVSEGSPVSPPFETPEELITYLAKNGDTWDQERGQPGWGVKAATAFVGRGWAPSLVVHDGEADEGKRMVDG